MFKKNNTFGFVISLFIQLFLDVSRHVPSFTCYRLHTYRGSSGFLSSFLSFFSSFLSPSFFSSTFFSSFFVSSFLLRATFSLFIQYNRLQCVLLGASTEPTAAVYQGALINLPIGITTARARTSITM